jgi:hypothetical protein
VLLNDDTTLPFVDVEKVVGLDSAPYRETIRDHEGSDGGFIDAEFERGRDVVLEGTVYASDAADATATEVYLDSIKANYAPVQTPIPFVFSVPGVEERLIFVKPRGVRYNWELLRRIGITPIQLMMFAEDPRIYTAEESQTTVSYGGDAGLGLAFSAGFSIDFGGGATPGGATVTNEGNRPAPVEFIITGPIINPVITNSTTDDTLGFTIELTASDTLTINTRNRTVYLNGNVNRRNTLNSPAEWFHLEPGDNIIGFGGLSGTGATLDINFRSAWR